MPNDDDTFNDGSEVEIVTPEEEPPKSGEWVDSEELIHHVEDDEVEMGNYLGQAIDPDDDEDNGTDAVNEVVQAVQDGW